MTRPRIPLAKNCVKCGRPLRPATVTLAEAPGTVRGRGEYCYTDAGHLGKVKPDPRMGRHQGKRLELTPEEQAERDARIKAELEAFIAARRARGVHPDGVILPGDPPPMRSSEDTYAARRRQCKRGHPFEIMDDSKPRPRCYICEKQDLQERRARKQQQLAS